MAILTFKEIFDLVIMSLALGFIFSGFFHQLFLMMKNKAKGAVGDLKLPYQMRQGATWQDVKLAMIVTAPAIVLHELGHKFVAVFFGLESTFHAAYGWLGFGLLLRLVNAPFIFFIPGYVSVPQTTTPGIMVMLAFAGPLMNLILYISSKIWLGKLKKRGKKVPPVKLLVIHLTKNINGFLFILNMIPIPPFDGGKVLFGLIELLKGASFF